MVLIALIVGLWVLLSSLGQDAGRLICPDGEASSIDLDAKVEEPSLREALEAQRDLPKGKRAAFNEYTGEFQAVYAVGGEQKYGNVTVPEPLVYACDPNNEPVLVLLWEVDPEAAEDAHRQFERQLRGSAESTGLGANPASVAR